MVLNAPKVLERNRDILLLRREDHSVRTPTQQRHLIRPIEVSIAQCGTPEEIALIVVIQPLNIIDILVVAGRVSSEVEAADLHFGLGAAVVRNVNGEHLICLTFEKLSEVVVCVLFALGLGCEAEEAVVWCAEIRVCDVQIVDHESAHGVAG